MGVSPISSYYGYSYVQQIFTKSEINANSAGNITGLRFFYDPSASLANSGDWKVYLGHTSNSSFSSVTDWIPVSQLTEIFNGTITASSGIVDITLTTPFAYNNTDNLVVAVLQTTPDYDSNSYDEVFYTYPSAQNTGLYYRSDNNLPNPQSPPSGTRVAYHSVVTFQGLMPSPLPACPLVVSPMNNEMTVPVTPDFTWNAVNGATSYTVSLGTSPGATDVLNSVSVTGTTYTVSSALTPGQTYYLTVNSVGPAGTSQGCSETKFSVLPAPPANDECTGAITISLGSSTSGSCTSTTVYSTLGATDSGITNATCWGNPNDDVWFKFVATSTSASILFSNITPHGNSSGYVSLGVFEGVCGSLNEIYCNDGSAGLLTGLTVGNTYYVRVFDYDGVDDYVSFSMCINTLPAAPANDDCNGAITLPVSSTLTCATPTSGTTVSATDSGIANGSCYGVPDDDVWYKFVATATSHLITINNAVGVGSSYVYPNFEVFSGACGSLASVTCSDISSAIVSGLTVGDTYYVRVFTEDSGDFMNFDICIGSLPPTPANDDCSGALVASSFPYTYSQTDAISSTNNAGFMTVCGSMNDGLWFTFTGNGSPITVDITMPSGSNFDAEVDVYTGACGNFTCVDNSDSMGGGGTETVTFTSVAGTTYYVNVGHYSSGTDYPEGNFTINITSPGPNLATTETITKTNGIKIHPNPFSDVLNISDVEKVKTIAVMDTSGKIVRSFDKATPSINLSGLNSGMYLVVLTMKDGSKQTIKAIKK